MARVRRINQFGSKGPTLGLTHPTAAHLDPLFTRALISGERHKGPGPSILAFGVHGHRIANSKSLPVSTAHYDCSGGWLFVTHAPSLADAIKRGVTPAT